ncbi:MAG: hypothetical protein V1779_13380 [bacterium]
MNDMNFKSIKIFICCIIFLFVSCDNPDENQITDTDKTDYIDNMIVNYSDYFKEERTLYCGFFSVSDMNKFGAINQTSVSIDGLFQLSPL